MTSKSIMQKGKCKFWKKDFSRDMIVFKSNIYIYISLNKNKFMEMYRWYEYLFIFMILLRGLSIK